jgi:hypothetical protein
VESRYEEAGATFITEDSSKREIHNKLENGKMIYRKHTENLSKKH